MHAIFEGLVLALAAERGGSGKRIMNGRDVLQVRNDDEAK